MKIPLPETPEQFRDQLHRLFPGFEPDVEEEEPTFHTVLMDFRPFYGRNFGHFSEKQFKGLADIVNAAGGSPGSLENAFDTCFFEALSSGILKPLRPFLSAKAKKAMRR